MIYILPFLLCTVLTGAVVLVTGCQLLCCGILAVIEIPTADTLPQKESPKLLVLLRAAIPHMLGALMTNYSMALMPAASTHFIKVMEPMFTATLAWFIVGVKFSRLKLFSMVIVIIGAVGASWDPSSSYLTGFSLGIKLALLSNLFYAVRNVTIKHLFYQDFAFQAGAMGKVSLLGAIMLSPICIGICLFGVVPQYSIIALAILCGSALCHATYTYISTCVILHYASVVGHALANVGKRVLVIVLLYLFGQKQYLSPIFVIICFLGLLLYFWGSLSQDSENKTTKSSNLRSNSHCIMTIVIITITSLMLLTFGLPAKTVTVVSEKVPVVPSMPGSTMLPSVPASTELPSVKIRLVDRPNDTDSTMKFMLNATSAVHEAQQILMQIYKEVLGSYKKAILVGLGESGNLGDHALAVGEFEALNKLGIEILYYCSFESCGNLMQARKVVDKESEPVMILASGGGNFCIWNAGCILREKLIQMFPEREVLVLPQSVDFSNKAEMKKHASIMNRHQNITYLFRDHQSYNIIVNSGVFKYNKAILSPDAAMMIGTIQPPIAPTLDILWLRRKDREAIYSKLPELPKDLHIAVEDWPTIGKRKPKAKNIKELSYIYIKTAFEFLSSGRVIISDRLHGHILSMLLGIPHVILDNSYKKPSNYHNTWTLSVENVLVASSAEDAIEKARYLLHKYY